MTIKLHALAKRDAFIRRRLRCNCSGLELGKPVKVDFFGGQTRTPDYRTTSTNMGRSPVLMTGETSGLDAIRL